MKAKRKISWSISLLLILNLIVFNFSFASANDVTFNVMAPLHVTDWSQFESNLDLAKTMGVDAVSVDVWWGDVEKNGDNDFDWSYYDTAFEKIEDSGLKIVAIMSFHQCGGNVGDDYTAKLPNWVWSKYEGESFESLTLSQEDLMYKSEKGNTSKEYISLWTDELVQNEYVDFMNAFESHYANMSDSFIELNISCGPAGELRYPSYNSHDGFTYPERGNLQCYSELAKKDFREFVIDKYGDLNGVNQAWGLSLASVDAINPPDDGAFFFSSQSHYLSDYGKDFIDWYNSALVEHGDRMLGYGESAFDDSMDGIALGIKIPGVHWQMTGNTPRIAEISAGLINHEFDADNNGHGYYPITSMIQSHSNSILHFTCLEMSNNPSQSSLAQDLVFWVAKAAEDKGVVIKGENALSGGNDGSAYWDNIDNAMTWASYKGLTVLRMNDVVHGDSNLYYYNLIQKHNPNRGVEFTVNNAETVLGEEVYVTGNHPSLGNWNPDYAVKLNPSNYPTWSVTVEGVPNNQPVAFKFIKKNGDQVIWQEGNNNIVDGTSFNGSW